jgi:TolB-like protein
MTDPPRRLTSLLAELKRRKVYQVAAVYVVVAIAGLELVDVVVPSSRLPEWSDELFLALAILGLPLALVLAWVFDITEDGVRRTDGRDAANHHAPRLPVAGAARETVGEPGASRAPTGEPGPGDADEPDSVSIRPADPDPRVVAVLPFENLSGTDEAEPFAAGLHDDLLTELSRASALTVISRTSVKGYRSTEKSIREIAGELGAGTIVEGGVQHAGDRVRLNVQLIDARTDAHLWAERYDRKLTTQNIFDLQSELAARIMAALEARLTAEEEARVPALPTDDLEAYRLYAMGRELYVDRTLEGLEAAIGYFERAIERDPDYAPAWAELALSLVALMDYGHVDADDWLPRAESTCNKALELDPDLAEAHSALGNLRSYRRDGPGALRAHARALELRPSYAGAHQWTAWVDLLVGDAEAAVDAGILGTQLDPLDPEARTNLAAAYLAMGKPELALSEARGSMERHAGFDYGRLIEALALYALDRADEASATLQRLTERWAQAWPDTARALDRIAHGDEAGAGEPLARLQAASAPFHLGLVHAALGDSDAAFEALRSAAPLAWDETLYLRYHRSDPLAGLGEDPRFATLLGELDRSWGVERGKGEVAP